jgi:hypothetical protein
MRIGGARRWCRGGGSCAREQRPVLLSLPHTHGRGRADDGIDSGRVRRCGVERLSHGAKPQRGTAQCIIIDLNERGSFHLSSAHTLEVVGATALSTSGAAVSAEGGASSQRATTLGSTASSASASCRTAMISAATSVSSSCVCVHPATVYHTLLNGTMETSVASPRLPRGVRVR